MKTRAGTRQALPEIIQWAEVEENGEALTLLIHRYRPSRRQSPSQVLGAPGSDGTAQACAPPNW